MVNTRALEPRYDEAWPGQALTPAGAALRVAVRWLMDADESAGCIPTPIRPVDHTTLNALGALSWIDRMIYAGRVWLIAEARREGASWTAIAKRLGVSKQAVQQRYGTLVEDGFHDVTDGDSALDWLETIEPNVWLDNQQRGDQDPSGTGWLSSAWLCPGAGSQLADLGVPFSSPYLGRWVRYSNQEFFAARVDKDSIQIDYASLVTVDSSTTILAERFQTIIVTRVLAANNTSASARSRFARFVEQCHKRDVRLLLMSEHQPSRVLDDAEPGSAQALRRLTLMWSR